MIQSQDHSPAVCLQLINDLAEQADHHCSLCIFFHGSEGQCQHEKAGKPGIQRATTPATECSFYTARSDVFEDDHFSLSSKSSASTLKARTQTSTSDLKQPCLRRKTSPTEVSLRDLNLQQASRLRLQQSEAELQRLYEEQIEFYLNSNYGDLGTIYGLTE